MPQVGFLYHDKFLLHETGHSHPENRHRLESLINYVRSSNFGHRVDWLEATLVDESFLGLNHTQGYIDYVRNTCVSSPYSLLDDGDTRVCDASFDVAVGAVGATIEGLQLINSGTYKRIFVACRPPGHHALSNHAMGFCLFNNVAIAANYALENLGVEKLMILDWDVHHGNGTQETFYQDPRVLFCSIHQYPFFPGTGASSEVGAGAGEHFNLNIPIKAGAEFDKYRDAMQNFVMPTAAAFEPEFLIISAGFDAHYLDPLSNMNLRDEDFLELTRLSVSIAEKYCDGKVLSVLEGGYHQEALARSVAQHLTALCEEKPDQEKAKSLQTT
jgi:acetoin utilization deacetylase AcuC-like enzyme